METIKPSSHSKLGNAMVAAWTVFPGMLLGYSHFTGDKLPLLFYYPGLELFPIMFIFATGSFRHYWAIVRGEGARGFVNTMKACAAALAIGLFVEIGIGYVTWLPKNAIKNEPGFWSMILDKSLWSTGITRDFTFLWHNPIAETFFFRVFLHRELAVRFFPSKAEPEAQLLHATQGTPVLPKLSETGAWVLSFAWGLYHIVPTILDNTPIFALAGYTYAIQIGIVVWLCVLGRWIVHMRESAFWGILASCMWHVGIDLEDVWLWSVVAKLTALGSA